MAPQNEVTAVRACAAARHIAMTDYDVGFIRLPVFCTLESLIQLSRFMKCPRQKNQLLKRKPA